jgi:hypothetical protein
VLPARAHEDRAGCNGRAELRLEDGDLLAPTDAPRAMADERREAAGETLTADEPRGLTGNGLRASGDPQATMVGRRAPTPDEQPPAPDLRAVSAGRADVQPEGVVPTATSQRTVDADPTAPPPNPPHGDAEWRAAVPVRLPPGGGGLIAATTRRPAEGLPDSPGEEDPRPRWDGNAIAQRPHPAVARTPLSLPGRRLAGGVALRVAAPE